ncbi:MAG: hypothetical protein QN174_01500 [Armatimonadota bacterium]|nr:hypothetical protein [Armatimonadota bacterium]MDR7456891.1 hypothetical protein [Armatimonadota bacterium]MDR7495622.1 hypothetical protein [Armatimonadota bacterium]
MAWVTTEGSARAAARFLLDRMLPAYRVAGRALQRVLTDHGSEYQGIRHSDAPPPRRDQRLRRTSTKHHPGRAVAHRRFFTRVGTIQDVLNRYLAFYNHQRPHLGYRTRGCKPAKVFMLAPEVH